MQSITWYKSLFCKYGQILVHLHNHGWARKHVSSIKEHQRQRKKPYTRRLSTILELCDCSLASSCPQGTSFGWAQHSGYTGPAQTGISPSVGRWAASSPGAAAASQCPGILIGKISTRQPSFLELCLSYVAND